jgi:hypothetical protein
MCRSAAEAVAVADRLGWTLTVGDADKPLRPDGAWGEAVRLAAAGEWGTVTAQRAGSAERLTLRFNEAFGCLEHWASEGGPVSGARFPNRGPVSEARVELPCCGCGIPLEVADEYGLRKADAVGLFLQFLDSGVLPRELAEPSQGSVQLLLPGLEEHVVPPAVLNVVSWEPL